MQELARIQRGDHGELRIEVTECADDRGNASQFVNLRLWYKTDDGTMKPGKQGLTIRKNEIHAVGKALRAALDFMNTEYRAPRQPIESMPKPPARTQDHRFDDDPDMLDAGGYL
jgi:hypothetical protein